MSLKKVAILGASIVLAFVACSDDDSSSSGKANESANDAESVVQKLYKKGNLNDSIASYLNEEDSTIISIAVDNSIAAGAYFIDLLPESCKVEYDDNSMTAKMRNGEKDCSVKFTAETDKRNVAFADFDDCEGLPFSKINFVDAEKWPENGFFNAVACLDSSSTQSKSFKGNVQACVAALMPQNDDSDSDTTENKESDVDLSVYGIAGLNKADFAVKGNEMRSCKKVDGLSNGSAYLMGGSKISEMTLFLMDDGKDNYTLSVAVYYNAHDNADDIKTFNEKVEKLFAKADTSYKVDDGMQFVFFLKNPEKELLEAINDKLDAGCELAKKNGTKNQVCSSFYNESMGLYSFSLTNGNQKSIFAFVMKDEEFSSLESNKYSSKDYEKACKNAEDNKTEDQTVVCDEDDSFVIVETREKDVSEETFAKRRELYNRACNLVNETGSSEEALKMLAEDNK